MELYEELKWRGLIKDISSPQLKNKLNKEKLTFYLGADPSSDSLQLGQLAVFLLAKRLKDAGHRSILLVGGATGRVGDPRPTAERTIIPDEVFAKNKEGIRRQVETLFNCDLVVDNYDWSKEINFVDYLRDYGKYFPINYMLDKETVRRRLETGITYTEFSYMIMQALDYLWLFDNEGCTLQIGGSDQWGNITAGIDLIKRKTGKEVYALSMPLVTDKFGKKMGKSEGNALWIDKNKTSSYELYQYLINTDDELVIDYLKIFTFLTKKEIEELESKMKTNPEGREATKVLAYEVVKFLHTESEAIKAKEMSSSLFSKNLKELTEDEIMQNFKDSPNFKINLKESIPILEFLVDNSICSSKREAKELISAGAITINDNKITDTDYVIKTASAIGNKILVIRKGKKKYYLGIIE